MTMHRRTLLGALGLGAASVAAASAQEVPAPPSDVAARILERAREIRLRLDYDGARFSGPAWDMLAEEARSAHFFCVGEEHGLAENPKLAAQLFSYGRYEKACVEISPPMARQLDEAAANGVDGLQRLFSDPGANVAFFGMREEAEWIAAARAATRRPETIWGLDYEVGADRRLIQLLKMKRVPVAARPALAALDEASQRAWAQYAETRNPQFIFSFSGDPALGRALREAWTNANEETDVLLETLEETLAINRLWVEGRGWESNQRRAQFNRRNLRRYWAAQDGNTPKVMFKFGASHMVRGLSHTHVFDVGTQAAELAESFGGRSFHLMVVPGPGAQYAQFDPSAWTYRPVSAGTYDAPLIEAAYPDAFTLIDMRPLRALAHGSTRSSLDADLVRAVHGFDAVLVLSNATPSSNL